MTEASASALERFLMTKFRTTTPPSCFAANANMDLTVLNPCLCVSSKLFCGIEEIRRNAPLPSSNTHWAFGVIRPPSSNSTAVDYEPDAYRPSGALYQNVLHSTPVNSNRVVTANNVQVRCFPHFFSLTAKVLGIAHNCYIALG
ncbi:unnamed protein product [Toxocara canis]|uniref:Uncharacterized protein n=1 Tax=Toxocara canis TaxID=6265 RepID=A0A183V9S4_TOXCA|nr:unnamed protein product [Toxocara canis]